MRIQLSIKSTIKSSGCFVKIPMYCRDSKNCGGILPRKKELMDIVVIQTEQNYEGDMLAGCHLPG